MSPSFWQILIVVALLVLLFGRGKISELMGDVAKGIKSFKKGIQEEPQEETAEAPETADELKTIEHEAAEPLDAPKKAAGSKAKT